MERTGGTSWRARPRAVLARVVTGCLLAVLAACSSSVSGAPTGAERPEPTSATPTAETSTPDPSDEATEEPEPTEESGTAIPAPPTSIDQNATQQYCQPFIIGPGNQRMQVVVVETPGGRVNCDQAAAVLVDYYAERPTPDPGSEPLVVAGYACGQVPVPDIPQVICGDGASLFYSMWVQGG
ncbi:hypothetical protein [Actinophytocola xanthii]|uniref:Subtilisin inhibitor domain-containing protein n=1 Tax=Actinophytocola xanthii TaxID=1912961 RepID=A0A1Q8CYF6_9PSEU|nr:hypothetical protein [Actinophytocola xanthii]OLF19390.1 hypothetical protein BU204_00210 [Actinophytocola xanthii]